MQNPRVPVVLMSLALALALAPSLAAADQASPDREARLTAANDELRQCYAAKDWPGALAAVDRMLALTPASPASGAPADSADSALTALRPGILYTKACVQALAGEKAAALETLRLAVAAGYSNYGLVSSDTDLDSLRQDREFVALLAELKAAHGPRPLVWDRSRPAPPFAIAYDDPATPQLLEMRREFAIDEVVEGAADDLERLRRLARWVAGRWEHSSNQMASKPDPLTILREAEAGGRFICRDYAIVMAGVAAAYGMPARVLNLLPRDVETRSEAHSVAEVWLDRPGKWVLVDGQFGLLIELDGVPLNGLEVQAALAEDRDVVCSAGPEALRSWKPFILRNAYYIKVGDGQRAFARASAAQLVLVPEGAPAPRKFAGGNEEVFAGAVYTSNPDSFYAPPAGRQAGRP